MMGSKLVNMWIYIFGMYIYIIADWRLQVSDICVILCQLSTLGSTLNDAGVKACVLRT